MRGIELTASERVLENKLALLKSEAGSHSPSIQTLRQSLPEIAIHVDACFLSNQYATELFMEHFRREVIGGESLRDLLEYYPSQNRVIARHLSRALGIPNDNIIVGNGASELIQAVLHRLVKGRIVIPIPTFSSYYEFANDDTEVSYFHLRKERGYELDVEQFVRHANEKGASAAVVINPNNPTGGYLTVAQLWHLLQGLRELDVVIVDESFIHFAYEGDDLAPIVLYPLVQQFPNLVLVKSMSKDFGVAGLRTGYAVMSSHRVATLLANGHLWNSNGIAEYFFSLYAREDFQRCYEEVRQRYIRETLAFERGLARLPGLRTYPTKANFVLVELLDGLSSEQLVSALLIRHGLYLRNCDDKIGLEGRFVRVASRGATNNERIVSAFRSVLG